MHKSEWPQVATVAIPMHVYLFHSTSYSYSNLILSLSCAAAISPTFYSSNSPPASAFSISPWRYAILSLFS